ncbi:hypothetical protein ASD64_01500 [Mesorhizobium sp. Root157]|nr:hypothetical protein ASD64_01500 [Mesorhizobium sp. Root157]
MTTLDPRALEAGAPTAMGGGRMKLLGGRPMKLMGFAFTDIVVGKPVFYWQDTLGRDWLAHGAWSIFRVPAGRSILDGGRDGE